MRITITQKDQSPQQNEAILAGAYKFIETKQADVRILASGVTLRFAIEAAENLRKMNIFAEVWSVTSFNQLAKLAV